MRKAFVVIVVIMFAVVLAGQVWAEEAEETNTDTAEAEKININTAAAKELVKLKRIGPKYAERIIEYRENNPFEKPEDITKVTGIGQKTYEANKDVIVVE